MGFSILLNGETSAIDWARNLGLSLFMSLLYYKGLDFFTLDQHPLISWHDPLDRNKLSQM